MNIKQAHYIRTIIQEGSITAAARKLYISQPSLSQTLRQIEAELGVTLLDRSVSPFRLTYAGEKYLQAANTILTASEQLENQLREIRQENSGRLRLGLSVQRAMQILPIVLPRFVEKYPQVEIDLHEEGSARLEEMLRQGEVDLALAAIDSTSPQLVYELIEKEVIGIIAGKQSTLCRTRPAVSPVTLSAAQYDKFIALKPGHSIRVVQEKLFHNLEKKPQILLETDSLEVAKRVALETGCCMLCSNIYVDETVRKHGAFYPLQDYDNHRHFYACYRKGERLPHYAADFIQIVSQVLEKENGMETSASMPSRLNANSSN